METYGVARVCAVLVFLSVIGVYVYCVGFRGVYPPAHPWAGVALLLLAFGMIRGARNRERSTPSIYLQIYMALVVLSSALWTISAIVRS